MAECNLNSQSNRGELQTIKQQLKLTEEELKHTQHQLQKTTQGLEDVKQAMEAGLHAKEQEINDIKKNLLQLKESLDAWKKETTENEEKQIEVTTRFDHDRSLQLKDKIDELITVQYYSVHKSLATWSILLNMLATASESGKQVLPVIVRMNGFLARMDRDVVNLWWYSPGFYSSKGGYYMCLGVVARGYHDCPEDKVSKADCNRGYVSAAVILMKGKYDDQLVWPKPASKVTIQLLNQISDADHVDPFNCRFDGYTHGSQRVTSRPISNWGSSCCSELISHDQLGYDESKNRQFLKDDNLMFRVYI